MIMENTNEVNSIKNDCNNPLFKISDPFCFIDLTENNEIKKEVIEDELPLKIEDSDGPKQTEDRPVEIFLNDFNEVKSESGALKTEYEDENVISYEENSNRAVEIHSDDSNETKRTERSASCSTLPECSQNRIYGQPECQFFRDNNTELNEQPTNDEECNLLVEVDHLHSPTCGVCGRQFSDILALTGHLKSRVCEKSSERSAYDKDEPEIRPRKAKKEAAARRPHKCSKCGRTFTHKGNLLTHEKIHLDRKPYQCPVCCRTFTQKGNMRAHERIHSGEKPYACTVCDYRCNQKSSLHSHLSTHARRDKYTCSTCEYSCFLKKDLTSHVRTHAPEGCPYCHYKCYYKGTLTSHMRTFHAAEPSYELTLKDYTVESAAPSAHRPPDKQNARVPLKKCHKCECQFSRLTDLKIHLKMHVNVYICAICNYKCRKKGMLVFHLRSHYATKPHKCPTCSRRFADADELEVHRTTHMRQEFVCAVCDFKTFYKSALLLHLRRHGPATGKKRHRRSK